MNPKLQFTIEKEKDNVINFSDITIIRNPKMYNMAFIGNLPLQTTLFTMPPVTQQNKKCLPSLT
jgi:hypothetical protein